MKKTLLSALVAGAFAVGMSGQASATTFYFDAWGGFTGAQQNFPDPEFLVANTINPALDQHLHWGTPTTGLESSMSMNLMVGHEDNVGAHDAADYNPNITGQLLVSNDPGAVIGSLVHRNFPIVGGQFTDLGLAQVNYFLDIYSDVAMTNKVWSSGMMDFSTEIWETPNGDDPCANGGANGVGVNVNGCADRFRYTQGYPVSPTGDIFDQQIGTFSFDGVNYDVSMNGFWDKDNNLVGAFWSPENDWSRMDVRAEVHVPEPASMALMGLGLIGLGLARRYRNKA